jgi:ankyrin repeat protein
MLIDNDVDPGVKDPNGWTPLYAAASKGHSAVVGVLLTHGVKVDASNSLGGALICDFHYCVCVLMHSLRVCCRSNGRQ